MQKKLIEMDTKLTNMIVETAKLRKWDLFINKYYLNNNKIDINTIENYIINEYWYIIIKKGSDDFQTIKAPNTAFYADPFVINIKNDTYLFFEEFDKKNSVWEKNLSNYNGHKSINTLKE